MTQPDQDHLNAIEGPLYVVTEYSGDDNYKILYIGGLKSATDVVESVASEYDIAVVRDNDTGMCSAWEGDYEVQTLIYQP